jgi:uncharacterized phage protein gp47/JayE
MAFKRPLLSEIHARLQSNIDSRTDGQPRLRRSPFGILATVVAGGMHEMYGYQAYKAQQILPDSADETHFERHASIENTTRNQDAYAVGNLEVTGITGSIIEAGRILQRGDGVEYSVDAEVSIAAGQAIIAVTALKAGAESNSDAGVALTFIDTLPGVDSQALVDADGISNGTDIEQLESWRERHIEIIQAPPQGGAKHDYIKWAKEVPGVTRAWCYSNEMGVGTTTVRFVRDNDQSIIPDAAEVQAVYDHIDEVRQTGMKGLYIVAPIAVPLDLTIALTPNTSLVQAAVEAEIADMLSREAQPEDGTGSATIKISHIREAISIATGETDHILVSPVADVTYSAGEMAVLGAFTWQ